MKEKEIIKGEKIDVKKICLKIIKIGAIFGGVVTLYSILGSSFYMKSGIFYILTSAIPYFMAINFGPFLLVSALLYFSLFKVELVVTDKRVYGKALFGTRVDLPLDTISAVGTSFLKGITVGTSAGKIHFKGITNNIEIHTEISKLLNNRQSKKDSSQESKKTNTISATEELKKYKELLDSGVITQEDFDAKKKQLLDL